MRDIVSIVVLVGLIALLVARALKPLFGIDPVGSFFDSVYGGSSRALLATCLVLIAMLLLFDVRRWRRHPERGFPGWDVAMHGAILIGIIVVTFIYADQLQ
jgi:hypothetical protein